MQSQQSRLRQFVHLHPFYSMFGFMSSLASLSFGVEYTPMLMISFQLGMELYNEFKHLKDSPHKVESQFKNADYKLQDVKLGELTHHDDLPLVKIYTDDPHLSAMTQASLMARYFPDFHTSYFWYLFNLARLVKGPRNMSAVDFINEEVTRRKIHMAELDLPLHYTQKEIYKAIIAYNQTAPFYLKRSDKFNRDYFKAILAFCEVEKGLGRSNGCTTSVIAKDGKKEMIRLVDWFTFGTFQNWQIEIVKPVYNSSRVVFSSTIIPGIIPGITTINDEGLEVAYNEVGGIKNNRQNPEGGWPGLVLTYKIAAECSTFADAEKLLSACPPASQNNLIIVAEDNQGVVQNMPSHMSANFHVVNKGQSTCVATNHFLDEKNQDIDETACIVGPVIGSQERRKKMVDATAEYVTSENRKSIKQIAEVAETKDTVKVLISEFDYANKDFVVKINTANASAVSAPDRKKSMTHYSTVNLVRLFSEVKDETQTAKQKLSEVKPQNIEELMCVDKSLVNLINKIDEIRESHPALAKNLTDFYSSLTEQLAFAEISMQQACLHGNQIKLIADETIKVINSIKNNVSKRENKFAEYEALLEEKIQKPNRFPIFNTDQAMDALFVTLASALFIHLTGNLIQRNAPQQLLGFLNDSFLTSAIKLFNASSVLYVSHFLFKKPAIVESSKAVISSLKLVR